MATCTDFREETDEVVTALKPIFSCHNRLSSLAILHVENSNSKKKKIR